MMEQGSHMQSWRCHDMIYQIGKYAGSMAAVLEGMWTDHFHRRYHDGYLVEKLSGMLKFIAPITVMAGEFEMEALQAPCASRMGRKMQRHIRNPGMEWI